MALTPIKVLLFLVGGTAAAGATAYMAGMFDGPAGAPPAKIAEPATPKADPKVAALPADEAKPAEPTTPPATAETPTAPETTPNQPPAAEAPATGVDAPSFDVVRVQADGSIVIAGRAAPDSKVEVVNGSRVIGSAVTTPDGDFAIVLDEPLKPGDYQLVLRSTTKDNVVATSPETAVVSIPETADGQVLALVEKPGAPAELITVPEPKESAPAPAVTETPPATSETPAAGKPAAPAGEDVAVATPEPAPLDNAAPKPPTELTVAVEAVEIEGRKIFIAGIADPGRLVRAYANDILLGEAKTSEGGRFLVEAERDLPVGDYIIRVDALAPNGAKVLARAAVPFEREPGENIAAVAPPAPSDAPQAPAPAAEAAQAPAQTPAPANEAAQAAAPAADEPPVADAPPPANAETPAEIAATQKPAEPTVDGPAPAEVAQTPGEPSPPAAPEPAGVAAAPAPDTTPPATMDAAPADVAQAPEAAPAAKTEPSAEEAAAPAEKPADVAAAPASEPAVAAAPAETTAPTEKPADVAAAPATPAAPAAAKEPQLATAPPETMAPKLQTVDSAVIIRRGDTLWRISRRVYGRGVRYSTIYLANQEQIRDPDRIWPGQVFKVPDKSRQGELADMTVLGEQAVKIVPYSQQ